MKMIMSKKYLSTKATGCVSSVCNLAKFIGIEFE